MSDNNVVGATRYTKLPRIILKKNMKLFSEQVPKEGLVTKKLFTKKLFDWQHILTDDVNLA